jgi:hypothetical protein
VAEALSVLVNVRVYVPERTVLRNFKTTCVFDEELIEIPAFAGELVSE